MAILPILVIADIADIFPIQIHRKRGGLGYEIFGSDIQISAPKMFADNRYADIEKKCRYADIADADINIGTSLPKMTNFN